VRNLALQPERSFWLPTSTDRFYPDFVALLKMDDFSLLSTKARTVIATMIHVRSAILVLCGRLRVKAAVFLQWRLMQALWACRSEHNYVRQLGINSQLITDEDIEPSFTMKMISYCGHNPRQYIAGQNAPSFKRRLQ
jgi:hypothetical protein